MAKAGISSQLRISYDKKSREILVETTRCFLLISGQKFGKRMVSFNWHHDFLDIFLETPNSWPFLMGLVGPTYLYIVFRVGSK